MGTPNDYLERVYAGVLGKLIGVYLGRPVEGWRYERITEEFGEINYYVHEKLGRPLVVPDDDISGTFAFVRALADHGNGRELSAKQIGDTWLNYIVPLRTILWWGGLGLSTEHTAFLRLRSGIDAPESGSIALNGRVVAEQIGAQIFIDGWAMVAPGDPELAAELAKRAAQVSHDGEAVFAAQLLAAMEAQAFNEPRLERLIETGLSVIPNDSLVARMIREIQEWAEVEPDWRAARRRLDDEYGYHKYPGNCHVIPNHGLIILSLLYGDDDFQKSLMIANTSGWDTDCNSGNVGCLLGIKNGLAGIESGPDWRSPVSDRLYLSTADGGRAITDAVREAYAIVNMGRSLQGERPLAPKDGARFHFEAPGSVQGFMTDESDSASRGVVTLSNVVGHSRKGRHALALRCRRLGPGRVARAATPTFIPKEALGPSAYQLMASPTLYSGQVLRLGLSADPDNGRALEGTVFIRYYDGNDSLCRINAPAFRLEPGAYRDIEWRVPDTGGCPIAEVGVELFAAEASDATVYLDYVTWSGTPRLRLARPSGDGTAWRRAWVDAVDHWRPKGQYQLAHDEGTGLLLYGTQEWTDYRVRAALTPFMAAGMGVAARVQGLRRYVAVMLCADGKARLIRMYDQAQVLAETVLEWRLGEASDLWLEVEGVRVRAGVGERLLFDVEAPDECLASGGIGLVCEEGCINTNEVLIEPLAAR